MELIKIIGVAFITTISASLLKSTKPELSFAITITGIIVILTFIIDAMKDTVSAFSEIAQITGIENGLIKILLSSDAEIVVINATPIILMSSIFFP